MFSRETRSYKTVIYDAFPAQDTAIIKERPEIEHAYTFLRPMRFKGQLDTRQPHLKSRIHPSKGSSSKHRWCKCWRTASSALALRSFLFIFLFIIYAHLQLKRAVCLRLDLLARVYIHTPTVYSLQVVVYSYTCIQRNQTCRNHFALWSGMIKKYIHVSFVCAIIFWLYM